MGKGVRGRPVPLWASPLAPRRDRLRPVAGCRPHVDRPP